MTDWIMIIITSVYVIATIFICYYNAQTAKATKQELEEIKNQFYQTNRPIVNYEVVYIRNSYYMLRLANNGSQTAYNLSISLNDESLSEIPNNIIREDLNRLKYTVRNLGVGQSYDIPIGTTKDEIKFHLKGTICYNGINASIYCDDFDVDCSNYAPFYSYKSDNDDFKDILRSMNRELSLIRKALSSSKIDSEKAKDMIDKEK